MTKKKQKEKGYNQAEILALNLSKITKIPFAPTLEKMIETKEQKGLNYKERSLNLKNAFKLIDKNLVKDKNILLVDDIVTTCATVNVCSQELSKYAKNIYICAIARNELKEN